MRGGRLEVRLANGESESPGESGYGVRKIFVGSLGRQFHEDQLRELVEIFGKVQDIKMFRTEAGESKGAAFVTFELAESAEAAIAGLNGTEPYPGAPQLLELRYAEKRGDKGKGKGSGESDALAGSGYGSGGSWTKIFLGNLGRHFHEDQLVQLVGKSQRAAVFDRAELLAKKGASRRMQRPTELVPIRYAP